MVYLLALYASALQMNTMKFKQDFIGPLFIDTALDKTHYRLKDLTGLLLDGTYHMNCIKKGSACTPLGIVDKFDTYETVQSAFYWFLPCLDLLPVALLFAYVLPGFLVPRCALLFWGIFVRGLHVETFVRVLRSSRCRLLIKCK